MKLMCLDLPSTKNKEGEFFRIYSRFVDSQLRDTESIRLEGGKHMAFFERMEPSKRGRQYF